jgi:hypothetical protein
MWCGGLLRDESKVSLPSVTTQERVVRQDYGALVSYSRRPERNMTDAAWGGAARGRQRQAYW